MQSPIRRALSFVLIGTACFVLGVFWANPNQPLLPREPSVERRFANRARSDLARHFRWSKPALNSMRNRKIISIEAAGTNCIVYLARPFGTGEWSYQACYSEDRKLLGLMAS